MSTPIDGQSTSFLPVTSFRQSGDFEFWRSNAAPVCDVSPVHSDFNTGQFISRQFYLDNALLSQSCYDSQMVLHTRKHVQEVGHVIRIQRFLRGGMIGRTDTDTPFEFRPGMVSIVDQSLTFETLHDPSIAQGIYVPKTLLGLDSGAPIRPIRLYERSTMARLIQAEMERLFNPLQNGHRTLKSASFERLLACASTAIKGHATDEDVRTKAREAMRDLICEAIEHRLTSPDINVAWILREFGVSRASLYRMFEADGGVRQYISHRRLFRAVAHLSTNPLRRGQVTEVAGTWGFTSDANFNRSVKRVFGTSPGALFDNSIAHYQALGVPLEVKGIKAFRGFISASVSLGRRAAGTMVATPKASPA